MLAGILCRPACPEAQACPGQDHLLAQAALEYEHRQDLRRAESAGTLYRRALRHDPACQAAALGLIRASIWIGVLSDGEKEMAAYAEARAAARRLLETRPGLADGHYWLGVALALQSNAHGPLEGWRLVTSAKASLGRALHLDPACDGGGPHRVLGRLYWKMPALIGGDKDLAEWHLRQALALAPHYWLNHLYLAALLGERSCGDEAQFLLKQVLTGPAPSGLLAEYRLWRQQALELLHGLENNRRLVGLE
ncbi:MAG: hypothetical protein HY794_10425 [Desulfarculus sp.]|nr:hypothetical protein [Desulfarculus sp.]